MKAPSASATTMPAAQAASEFQPDDAHSSQPSVTPDRAGPDTSTSVSWSGPMLTVNRPELSDA
ncbi:MAG TPA: hypothetical protein VEF71_03995 [Streptosporangiaceae bacterium]|nr:hypothetical protein [Streptosporangiaceae bacterium]